MSNQLWTAEDSRAVCDALVALARRSPTGVSRAAEMMIGNALDGLTSLGFADVEDYRVYEEAYDKIVKISETKARRGNLSLVRSPK